MSIMRDTYETQAKGLRILPGQWRPHYAFEQIAWVSPPWPSQDYVWLDFPEAIFTDRGLIFLSHINPDAPSLYHDLPKVPWEITPEGMQFERMLPNGVRFGGSVTRASDRAVDLGLWIENGSGKPLREITLQTCAFLRACREFADFTQDNKFVHTPDAGWLPFAEAQKRGDVPGGRVSLGWRSGPCAVDWPIMAVMSNKAPRLLAMTWYEHTLSLVGNPGHPCMHADPFFPDLAPGARHAIEGTLLFFDGDLDTFTAAFGREEGLARLR